MTKQLLLYSRLKLRTVRDASTQMDSKLKSKLCWEYKRIGLFHHVKDLEYL